MASSVLKSLLFKPLSVAYGAVTWTRNKLFDWGALKSKEFDIPIIVVGNLAVGGTGKTPHTEYIVNVLRKTYNVGILSRGYKRVTRGFVLATPHSTPRDIGDESYQMYHKFGRKVTVAVCEDRVAGISKMLEINPKLDVIVLDDAFQHRYVKPRISIVLTEYDNPVFEDSMLPYGRLRESSHGLLRADMVIATKCPADITPQDYSLFDKKLNLYPSQLRFFSRFRYERLRPVFPDLAVETPRLSQLSEDDSVLALCGIGNPRPFVRHIKDYDVHVRVNVFPDHHEYTRADADLLTERFKSMAGENKYIITTEKDAVRLINNPYFPHELKPYIFFLPVRVEFIDRRGTVPTMNGRTPVVAPVTPQSLAAKTPNDAFDAALLKLLNQKSFL